MGIGIGGEVVANVRIIRSLGEMVVVGAVHQRVQVLPETSDGHFGLGVLDVPLGMEDAHGTDGRKGMEATGVVVAQQEHVAELLAGIEAQADKKEQLPENVFSDS